MRRSLRFSFPDVKGCGESSWHRSRKTRRKLPACDATFYRKLEAYAPRETPMVHTTSSPDEARPLADWTEEIATWSLADRLRLVRRLAEQVETLHRSGQTHRAIDFDTVIVDGHSEVQLASPPARRRFGGDHAGPRFCPTELARAEAIELPADADVAARLLEKAGFPFDPTRIDVYQLGVLLCVLLTGEPIEKIHGQSKTKNSVPVAVRSLLARAVGFDIEERFVHCRELIAALDEAIRRVDAPAEQPCRRHAEVGGRPPPTRDPLFSMREAGDRAPARAAPRCRFGGWAISRSWRRSAAAGWGTCTRATTRNFSESSR